MRDDKRFILDGFVFSTRKDYERACKEKETIEYLVANSNMSDMKAVLKIYNKFCQNLIIEQDTGYVSEFAKKIYCLEKALKEV